MVECTTQRLRVSERLTAGRNLYVPSSNMCNLLPLCISYSRVYVCNIQFPLPWHRFSASLRPEYRKIRVRRRFATSGPFRANDECHEAYFCFRLFLLSNQLPKLAQSTFQLLPFNYCIFKILLLNTFCSFEKKFINVNLVCFD